MTKRKNTILALKASMNRPHLTTADHNSTTYSVSVDDNQIENEENQKEEYGSLICVSGDAVYRISTLDYELYDIEEEINDNNVKSINVDKSKLLLDDKFNDECRSYDEDCESKFTLKIEEQEMLDFIVEMQINDEIGIIDKDLLETKYLNHIQNLNNHIIECEEDLSICTGVINKFRKREDTLLKKLNRRNNALRLVMKEEEIKQNETNYLLNIIKNKDKIIEKLNTEKHISNCKLDVMQIKLNEQIKQVKSLKQIKIYTPELEIELISESNYFKPNNKVLNDTFIELNNKINKNENIESQNEINDLENINKYNELQKEAVASQYVAVGIGANGIGVNGASYKIDEPVKKDNITNECDTNCSKQLLKGPAGILLSELECVYMSENNYVSHVYKPELQIELNIADKSNMSDKNHFVLEDNTNNDKTEDKNQLLLLKQELNNKNNEIYRLNEEMNLLSNEYNKITNKNTEINTILDENINIDDFKLLDNKIDNKDEDELIEPAPGIILSEESGPKDELIGLAPGIILSEESGPKDELIGLGVYDVPYRINIDTEDLNDSKDESQRNEAVIAQECNINNDEELNGHAKEFNIAQECDVNNDEEIKRHERPKFDDKFNDGKSIKLNNMILNKINTKCNKVEENSDFKTPTNDICKNELEIKFDDIKKQNNDVSKLNRIKLIDNNSENNKLKKGEFDEIKYDSKNMLDMKLDENSTLSIGRRKSNTSLKVSLSSSQILRKLSFNNSIDNKLYSLRDECENEDVLVPQSKGELLRKSSSINSRNNKLLLLCAYNIYINNIIILNTYIKYIMDYIVYVLVQIFYFPLLFEKWNKNKPLKNNYNSRNLNAPLTNVKYSIKTNKLIHIKSYKHNSRNNGIFECMLCDCLGRDIIQQFTQPIICKNQQCGNRKDIFVGCIDIVLSNEECEKYKFDDNILFSATLIVVSINQTKLIKNDGMNNIGLKSIGIKISSHNIAPNKQPHLQSKTEVPTNTDLYDISNSNKLVSTETLSAEMFKHLQTPEVFGLFESTNNGNLILFEWLSNENTTRNQSICEYSIGIDDVSNCRNGYYIEIIEELSKTIDDKYDNPAIEYFIHNDNDDNNEYITKCTFKSIFYGILNRIGENITYEIIFDLIENNNDTLKYIVTTIKNDCKLETFNIQHGTNNCIHGTDMIEDTKLINGLVFNQEASKDAGGPIRINNQRIALIQFQILPKTDMEDQLVVVNQEEMDRQIYCINVFELTIPNINPIETIEGNLETFAGNTTTLLGIVNNDIDSVFLIDIYKLYNINPNDDCIKLRNIKICQVIKDQRLNEKCKYDYFGIKTLAKAYLSKLNGRIAWQPHTIENDKNYEIAVENNNIVHQIKYLTYQKYVNNISGISLVKSLINCGKSDITEEMNKMAYQFSTDSSGANDILSKQILHYLKNNTAINNNDIDSFKCDLISIQSELDNFRNISIKYNESRSNLENEIKNICFAFKNINFDCAKTNCKYKLGSVSKIHGHSNQLLEDIFNGNGSKKYNDNYNNDMYIIHHNHKIEKKLMYINNNMKSNYLVCINNLSYTTVSTPVYTTTETHMLSHTNKETPILSYTKTIEANDINDDNKLEYKQLNHIIGIHVCNSIIDLMKIDYDNNNECVTTISICDFKSLVISTEGDETHIAKEIEDFVFKLLLIVFVLGITFFIIHMVENGNLVANVVFLIDLIATVLVIFMARRMFDKNVTVKNLESVQILVSTSVICTDNPVAAVKGDFYKKHNDKIRNNDFLKLVYCGVVDPILLWIGSVLCFIVYGINSSRKCLMAMDRLQDMLNNEICAVRRIPSFIELWCIQSIISNKNDTQNIFIDYPNNGYLYNLITDMKLKIDKLSIVVIANSASNKRDIIKEYSDYNINIIKQCNNIEICYQNYIKQMYTSELSSTLANVIGICIKAKQLLVCCKILNEGLAANLDEILTMKHVQSFRSDAEELLSCLADVNYILERFINITSTNKICTEMKMLNEPQSISEILTNIQTDNKSMLKVLWNVNELQKPFRESLLNNIETFKKVVLDFDNDSCHLNKPTDATVKLNKFEREFDTIFRKYELYSSSETLFGPKAKYDQIIKFRDEQLFLTRLYNECDSVVYTMYEYINQWIHNNEYGWISEYNISNIMHTCQFNMIYNYGFIYINNQKMFNNNNMSYCISMKQYNNTQSIVDLKSINNNNNKYGNKFLSLSKGISKSSIRERHWIEISENIKVDDYKQLRIENEIKKIKQDWDLKIFEFSSFKSHGKVIVKGSIVNDILCLCYWTFKSFLFFKKIVFVFFYLFGRYIMILCFFVQFSFI